MRAGRLDRRITIQGQSIAHSDSGQEKITWVDVATVWAEKREDRGTERFATKQIIGHAVTTFRIRWSDTVSAVTSEHRIEFDGRIFNITDVRELGRREGIEIDAYAPSEEPVAT
jgi:SPP1 family predicted phage head-tail adaptor